MRPSATIQVATMEFVTGKPNGRAISTAFCEGPCSAGMAVADPAGSTALVEIAEAFLSSAFMAKAQPAPRHIKTATQSADMSLVFNLVRPRHSVPSHFHSQLLPCFKHPGFQSRCLLLVLRYCTLGRGT